MDAILRAKGSTELFWALGSAFLFAAERAREFKLPVVAVLLLAVLGLLLYGVSIVLALRKRKTSTTPPHQRTPKRAWLRWRPLVLLVLAILLPFAFNYWRFADWGLPWDLQLRQSHLKTLRIATKLTSWSWVSDGIEVLILTGAEVPSLRHLPRNLRELGLRNGTIAFSSSPPDSIARLDLRQTNGTIRRWPGSLVELKLGGRMVDNLDTRTLVPVVTRLVLKGCPPFSLAQLPHSITDLELDCQTLQSLDGIPPELELESLVLSHTRLTSLDGVPKSVTRLVLIDNSSLGELKRLPPRLTSLYVRDRTPIQPTHLSGSLLLGSLIQELSVDWSVDVNELPGTLIALSVPNFTTPQVRLPPRLRSLRISRSVVPKVVDWGRLECLDLGFEKASVRFNDMPRWLRVLRTSIEEGQPLQGLPDGLETLDLQESGDRKISMRDLAWIPRTVTKLNIDWLHATGISSMPSRLKQLKLAGAEDLAELPDLGALPLETLSVQNSAISSLPRLPQSLRHLNIAGSKIKRLSNLPDKLRSLRVAPDQLTSLWGLWGLPKSVEELSFEDDEGGGITDDDWRISACEVPSRQP